MSDPDQRRILLEAADGLVGHASRHLSQRLRDSDGGIDPAALRRHQRQAHGVAWLAAHAEGLRALFVWASEMERAGALPELEGHLLSVGTAEFCARMATALPMSPTEQVRPAEMGIAFEAARFADDPSVYDAIQDGSRPETRRALTDALVERGAADPLDAPRAGLEELRAPIRRFAEKEIAPQCHGWHLADRLIPDEIVEKVAALGAFALTLPEAYGGLGQSKRAMVAVTEELAAVHLATGSLATRAEIAGELIARAGTDDQKARFLPGIASGAILPTAVFTEPDVGSDLAHLSTRAERRDGTYHVTGAKTWSTHGARSDLMTLLVRTDPKRRGHDGLSMLLAEKPRGTVEDPFPVHGLSGSEIRTLGYRGLKEYALSFDGFAVPAAGLLGNEEGQGFRQLMATFESARIQTAARAVGVARGALAAGLDYATTRKQFGEPLVRFPRIADKLALIAAETHICRQLTLAAAGAKDTGRRCDVEAGMAKLLAARAAWAAADDALQIHGGMGYAEESEISRILVDARILNIFEGTGEIQAQVIARGLLSDRN